MIKSIVTLHTHRKKSLKFFGFRAEYAKVALNVTFIASEQFMEKAAYRKDLNAIAAL